MKLPNYKIEHNINQGKPRNIITIILQTISNIIHLDPHKIKSVTISTLTEEGTPEALPAAESLRGEDSLSRGRKYSFRLCEVETSSQMKICWGTQVKDVLLKLIHFPEADPDTEMFCYSRHA
jgi:hypothetical protein